MILIENGESLVWMDSGKLKMEIPDFCL